MVFLKKSLETIFLKGLELAPDQLMKHCFFLLKSYPSLPDRWGYHIRPIHYYEPLPNFQEIQSEQLTRKRKFPGIEFNLAKQVAMLKRLGHSYQTELEQLSRKQYPESFDFQNNYFANLDACLYYALIRELKPAKIIEIGSGYSTRIAAQALKRNLAEGNRGKLICIEPYPEPRLTEANLDIELIQQRVEEVDLNLFSNLQVNDILFIDSSHVAYFNSDVCREFLEILPTLNIGVWIHIHDIFFPYDYPKEWLLEQRLAFNEQYILEAFLKFNQAFSICAANYWLKLEHNDAVRALCPEEAMPNNHLGCSSFWIRKEA